jgi:hypothetical protein
LSPSHTETPATPGNRALDAPSLADKLASTESGDKSPQSILGLRPGLPKAGHSGYEYQACPPTIPAILTIRLMPHRLFS